MSPPAAAASGPKYLTLGPLRWQPPQPPVWKGQRQATKFGPVNLPPIDREYWNGSDRGRIPQVSGLPASEATSRLQGAGFKVSELDVDSGRPQGTVVFTAPSDSAMPGSTVTIYVSNGRRAGGDEGGPTETTVVVPGVGPVVIQLPG